MLAVGVQEPVCAKQAGTSDKPVPAKKTSTTTRARVGTKCRKTREAIEDGADERVMADEDGEFIT